MAQSSSSTTISGLGLIGANFTIGADEFPLGVLPELIAHFDNHQVVGWGQLPATIIGNPLTDEPVVRGPAGGTVYAPK